VDDHPGWAGDILIFGDIWYFIVIGGRLSQGRQAEEGVSNGAYMNVWDLKASLQSEFKRRGKSTTSWGIAVGNLVQTAEVGSII